MNRFELWLGPSLRRRYKNALLRPANWRMITMLSSLDEQAEEKEQDSPTLKELEDGNRPLEKER